MNLQMYSALLIISLFTVPLSSKAGPVPNEEHCRKAITEGLEQLHRIPPETGQRDDEARKKLLAEMERLVETNRRQGISECQTWTQMMGKAFNQ